jgi:hypothetical protein
MKPYLKIIIEMAAPREEDIAKRYYHGTTKIQDASDIINNGIKPPDLTARKGKFRPREGKIYITPDIRYAQIYAIGGDIAGSDYIPSEAKEHGFGYLFVIDGKDLKDIEPDEDGVGKYVCELLNKKENELTIHESHFLYYHVTNFLTPKQKQQVKWGEVAEWAHVGKKIIPRLNSDDIFRLIDLPYMHIAHHGAIKPIEAWRIDLHKMKDLKRDGSNFFKVAERIK